MIAFHDETSCAVYHKTTCRELTKMDYQAKGEWDGVRGRGRANMRGLRYPVRATCACVVVRRVQSMFLLSEALAPPWS